MTMDLDTYLRSTGTSGVEFAATVGVTEASLSRIRRGKQNITRDLIRRIVEKTGGQVTIEDLIFPLVADAADTAPACAPSPDMCACGIAQPAGAAAGPEGGAA